MGWEGRAVGRYIPCFRIRKVVAIPYRRYKFRPDLFVKGSLIL